MIEQPHYRWQGGMVVDNFAGGGGASTGIAQAIGKSPDIAVNHNAQALAMHEENHPTTKHFNESVWDIQIRKATGNSPVLFGWFSPDCTHFSVAKGGKPVKKAIRGLAWIVKKWAGQADMATLFMENVVEFLTWGPLIAKRCKKTKRVIKLVEDGVDKHGNPAFIEVVAEPGEYVAYRDQALVPDKKRAGKTFRQFIAQLKKMGYVVEWKEEGLVASDFGEPTRRKRFFLVARKDGLPISWPAPTHCDPELAGKLQIKLDKQRLIKSKKSLEKQLMLERQINQLKGLQTWRTAGENLDWSIDCPSIFAEGRRPLAESTLSRIAKGIQKFVKDAGDRAFIVKANHTAPGYNTFRGQGIHEPLRTVTSTHGFAVAEVDLQPVAGLITKFNENSLGQSASEPLDTVMAGAQRFGAVEVGLQPVQAGFIATIDHNSTQSTATGLDEPVGTVTSKARHIHVAALLKHFTGVVGQDLDKPLPTITAIDHNSVLEAELMQVGHIQRDFGNSVGHAADEPLGSITAGGGGKSAFIASSLVKLKGTCNHGQSLNEPIGTIAAQGNHYAQVNAFLVKYFSTGDNLASLDDPLPTITSRDGIGLVTIHNQDYQIVDIGMRMLEPHELYRCQGFPADYRHEVVMGQKLPKHAQVRMVGNSVPPGLARALVTANIPLWTIHRKEVMAA